MNHNHIEDIVHEWITYAGKDKDVRSIVFGGNIDLDLPTKEEYFAEFKRISNELSCLKRDVVEKEKEWEEEEDHERNKVLVDEAISIKNNMKGKIHRLREIYLIVNTCRNLIEEYSSSLRDER